MEAIEGDEENKKFMIKIGQDRRISIFLDWLFWFLFRRAISSHHNWSTYKFRFFEISTSCQGAQADQGSREHFKLLEFICDALSIH